MVYLQIIFTRDHVHKGSFPSLFTTGQVFSFCPETRCRLVFFDICQQIGKFLKTIQNESARKQEPVNILL